MLKDHWDCLLEEIRKRKKWIIYSILIGFPILVLVLGITLQGTTDALVAFGTISMALAILYIEIIKPWLQKPRIEIEFKNKPPFCVSAQPITRNGRLSSNFSYHIRLKVTNKGKSVAKKLRGKLLEILTITDEKKEKPIDFFNPVFLHWSSEEFARGDLRYLNPLDLCYKEYDYLDIVFTQEQKKDLVTICTNPFPRGCIKWFGIKQTLPLIKRPVFQIVIVGENIEPATQTYKLIWDGEKYDGIKLELYKEIQKP